MRTPTSLCTVEASRIANILVSWAASKEQNLRLERGGQGPQAVAAAAARPEHSRHHKGLLERG